MSDLSDFKRIVYEPETKVLRAEVRRLREALERAQAFQPRRIEWFREHGIVFDRAPGSTLDDWQQIAFEVYTDLCEIESIARAALGSGQPADSQENPS
jgi:hypothetical protein